MTYANVEDRRAAARRRYAANLTAERVRGRAKAKAHRATARAAQSRWRAEHPAEWAAQVARRPRAALRANDARYRAAHPGEWRERHLKRSYGITAAEYDALFEAQGGLCAICRRPETRTRKGVLLRLHVDHDHRTGRRRGLLCGACNNGIGHLGDDPARLRLAATYLEAFA